MSDIVQNIDNKYKELAEKEGVPGNTLTDTTDLQEELFNNDWVKDAEQIPLDLVSPLEREYLTKYINKEYLTETDKEIVQDILAKYRPAVNKVQPAKVLENVEYNKLLIEDETKFLELVDDYNNTQLIYFTWYKGNQEIQMMFDLYPLEDSTAIKDITDNLSFLKDLTQDEAIVYNKMQNGETLTREEVLVRAGLQQKIEQATFNHTRETLIEYLAIQLKFHGKNSTIENMKKVFSKIPNAYLSVLFDEVQKRNHISDINTDKVFQPFE